MKDENDVHHDGFRVRAGSGSSAGLGGGALSLAFEGYRVLVGTRKRKVDRGIADRTPRVPASIDDGEMASVAFNGGKRG